MLIAGYGGRCPGNRAKSSAGGDPVTVASVDFVPPMARGKRDVLVASAGLVVLGLAGLVLVVQVLGR